MVGEKRISVIKKEPRVEQFALAALGSGYKFVSKKGKTGVTRVTLGHYKHKNVTLSRHIHIFIRL